jgi:hypothetical protein
MRASRYMALIADIHTLHEIVVREDETLNRCVCRDYMRAVEWLRIKLTYTSMHGLRICRPVDRYDIVHVYSKQHASGTSVHLHYPTLTRNKTSRHAPHCSARP